MKYINDLLQKTLISVIIPVYNVESYVYESIQSVLNQSYTNLEVLIVNDGSTDRSGIICYEISKKDNRIRIINQKNMGLSAARNTGIRNALGEYFVFVDSDDIIEKDLVLNLYLSIKNNNTEISVCGFREEHVCPDKTFIYSFKNNFTLTRKEVLEGLYCKNILSFAAWSKMYHRRLWEDIEFPVGKVYEDIITIPLVLSKCNCISFSNYVGYVYKRHENSITLTLNKKYIDDYIYAVNFSENTLKSIDRSIYETSGRKELRYLRLYFYLWRKCCLYNIKDKVLKESLYNELALRIKDTRFLHDYKERLCVRLAIYFPNYYIGVYRVYSYLIKARIDTNENCIKYNIGEI